MDQLASDETTGLGATPLSRISRGVVRAVFLVTVLTVAYFGLISDSPLPDHRLVVVFNDLVLHFVAFAIVTTLALLLWQDTARALCLLVAGAVLLELSQAFLPTREFSMLDVGSSAAGVAVSAPVVSLLRRFVARRKHFPS